MDVTAIATVLAGIGLFSAAAYLVGRDRGVREGEQTGYTRCALDNLRQLRADREAARQAIRQADERVLAGRRGGSDPTLLD